MIIHLNCIDNMGLRENQNKDNFTEFIKKKIAVKQSL